MDLMNRYVNWLRGFLPKPTTVNFAERLRASIGALLGILLTGLISRWVVGTDTSLPLLVAPMGASAVLLFAMPSSPVAQPWSIIGGNMISAIVGVTCAQWIPNPILAASLAVSIAIAVMLSLRCLHPPGGAVALTAVLGGPLIHGLGYHFVLMPIGLNSALLLAVALVFNNLTRHRYPYRVIDHANAHLTADRPPFDRLGFTTDDLDYVLARYNQVPDVSRDELESLLVQTEMHAYRRRFGEIKCADIMSHDVVSVAFDTKLQDAWGLLHQHHIKALPVIDETRRVIGIVTLSDFIDYAAKDSLQGYLSKMRHFLRNVTRTPDDNQTVVGQIMTPQVHTAPDTMFIAELVDLMFANGHRHIPVINTEHCLVGIVTNSDLIVGLYRGRLADIDQKRP